MLSRLTLRFLDAEVEAAYAAHSKHQGYVMEVSKRTTTVLTLILGILLAYTGGAHPERTESLYWCATAFGVTSVAMVLFYTVISQHSVYGDALQLVNVCWCSCSSVTVVGVLASFAMYDEGGAVTTIEDVFGLGFILPTSFFVAATSLGLQFPYFIMTLLPVLAAEYVLLRRSLPEIAVTYQIWLLHACTVLLLCSINRQLDRHNRTAFLHLQEAAGLLPNPVPAEAGGHSRLRGGGGRMMSTTTEQIKSSSILQHVDSFWTWRNKSLAETWNTHKEFASVLESLGGVRWVIPFNQLALGQKIAAGGSGQVFRGTYGGQAVAVKELFTQMLDNSDVREFRNECTSLANLKHPKIITMYGVSTDAANLYLVTELLDSNLGSLLADLQNEARLDPHVFLQIARQIAEGMAYLHDQHCIHRDLKPENILLDDKMNIKLCDFGTCVGTSAKKSAHNHRRNSSRGGEYGYGLGMARPRAVTTAIFNAFSGGGGGSRSSSNGGSSSDSNSNSNSNSSRSRRRNKRHGKRDRSLRRRSLPPMGVGTPAYMAPECLMAAVPGMYHGINTSISSVSERHSSLSPMHGSKGKKRSGRASRNSRNRSGSPGLGGGRGTALAPLTDSAGSLDGGGGGRLSSLSSDTQLTEADKLFMATPLTTPTNASISANNCGYGHHSPVNHTNHHDGGEPEAVRAASGTEARFHETAVQGSDMKVIVAAAEEEEGREKRKEKSQRQFVQASSSSGVEEQEGEVDDYELSLQLMMKADVYAYGIILWELFTLSRVFPHFRPHQIAAAVMHERMRPHIDKVSFPPRLSQLMMRCWHEDPHSRPGFTQILLHLADPKLLDPPKVVHTPLKSLQRSISHKNKSFQRLIHPSNRESLRAAPPGRVKGAGGGGDGGGGGRAKGGGGPRVRMSKTASAPMNLPQEDKNTDRTSRGYKKSSFLRKPLFFGLRERESSSDSNSTRDGGRTSQASRFSWLRSSTDERERERERESSNSNDIYSLHSGHGRNSSLESHGTVSVVSYDETMMTPDEKFSDHSLHLRDSDSDIIRDLGSSPTHELQLQLHSARSSRSDTLDTLVSTSSVASISHVL